MTNSIAGVVADLIANDKGIEDVACAMVANAPTDVMLPNLYDNNGNNLHITLGKGTEVGAAQLFVIGTAAARTEVKSSADAIAEKEKQTMQKNALRDAKG
ncbi:MAG: hypothetical protein NTZ10_03775 [Candidatus Saganbacteria bacterium]|nr:hypothetical protein [Candidatus Saganbacteria bacterium]